MSQFLRRILSIAVMSILLCCTAVSPLSQTVQAKSKDTGADSYVLSSERSAPSVRDKKDGSGIDTDVIRQDQLVRSNGKYRCKLSNGQYLKKSWKTFGSKTYFFNKKGYALTGLQRVGGKYYYFSSKGVLKKGWIKYNNHYYYGSVNKNGQLLHGWKKIGGKRYYISCKTHYRLTGFQYISKKTYYFNSKGVQQTTDQVVGGKKVVFNSDGSVYSYGGVPLVKTAASSSGSGSSKGQQVVNYALRFVGNPYKWGGSSLTKGCDCSGYVMAVYAHFGVQLPHYDAWIRKRGTAVSGGLANARPGDVICYDGHVAIYMGGGKIVHAADYKYGICISNNAAYRRILSIRRFF